MMWTPQVRLSKMYGFHWGRQWSRPLLLASLLMMLGLGWLVALNGPPAELPSELLPSAGQLPLRFIPNAGQAAAPVAFQAHSPVGHFAFTADGLALRLRPATTAASSSPHQIQLQFEQTNPVLQILGQSRQQGRVNYFLGNDPGQWQTNLPTYAALTYHDLYPGIDLRYDSLDPSADPAHLLKGTFTVAPGADPAQIRWRYHGVEGVRLDRAGDLILALPAAKLIEQAPIAWQMIDGQRVTVPVSYRLRGERLSFVLPQGYDPSQPLIIDPVLSYATYLGGSGFDYSNDIAVDGTGHLYVTGSSSSTDLPTDGSVQPDNGGAWDVFVAKLTPDGSDLVYATYLGGAGLDAGFGIAVDEQGRVTITGDTGSADFPTQNPVQGSSGAQFDAFIARLDASGSQLLYSTYLGGGNDERAYDVALDGAGNATVVGYTRSADFPTWRAIQPTANFGGGLSEPPDAFVTSVISQSGVYTWGFSTYLGGTDWDEALALAVAADGQTTVTGHTRSTDFPMAQPTQPIPGGDGFDAFVTQIITQSGAYTFSYSTYLGGLYADSGRAVALTDAGPVIAGSTTSLDFPLRDPLQATHGGLQDAFVTSVISQSGVYTWGFSTYLGGSGEERGQAVAVDGDGAIHLAGFSRSTDFPVTTDAYDSTCGTIDGCTGSGDVFVAKLTATDLLYATYLGGQMTDFGSGLAVDSAGNVYVGGETQSPDFPATTGAYDSTCNDGTICGPSGSDAFAAKFSYDSPVTLRKSSDPADGATVTLGQAIDYEIVVNAQADLSGTVVITDLLPSPLQLLTGSLTSTLGSPTVTDTQISLSLPSLTASTTVTLSFRAAVITAPTTLANRAVLRADQLLLDSNLVSHAVIEPATALVYLPIIFKNFGEAPPPTPTPTGTPPPTSTPAACAPSIIDTISVGNTPQGVAVDSSRQRVYVANQGGNSLSVIDSSSNSVLTTITGLASPRAVALDPQRNILWVTSLTDSSVTPIQANGDSTGFTLLTPVAVGTQPGDVAYNPLHEAVYVVNNGSNSLSIIDAETRAVTATLTDDFDQPVQLAVNGVTGKVYVANFGSNSVSVVNDTILLKTVSLFDSSQPYGIAVDELRNLIYVTTVNSHRIVAVSGVEDEFLGWAAFNRGSDPNRPVPLRAVAINPDIGPLGDGGHLWSLTATEDGSQFDQILLIPKGWASGFNSPIPYTTALQPTADLAIDRATDRVYIANGLASGTITVLQDGNDSCLVPFAADEAITLELFSRE